MVNQGLGMIKMEIFGRRTGEYPKIEQKEGVEIYSMFALGSQSNLNDRLAKWSLEGVRELFSLIRSQINGQSQGIALYNNGQPLPKHWLESNIQKGPGDSNSKPKKPIYDEESKFDFKPKIQNEPKKKANKEDLNQKPEQGLKRKSECEEEVKTNKEEEFVAKYDKHHDIYYRGSTRKFFAMKEGTVLSEKETAEMIGDLKASLKGFGEKLNAFKRNKGL